METVTLLRAENTTTFHTCYINFNTSNTFPFFLVSSEFLFLSKQTEDKKKI